MFVEDMMETDTPVVNDFDSIQEVTEYLSRRKLDGVCVVDLNQNMVGYFSINEFFRVLVDEVKRQGPAEEDFPDQFLKKCRQVEAEEVSDSMREDFLTLSPGQSESEVLTIFLTTSQEFIPVIKDQGVHGVVSKTRFLEMAFEQEK